MKYCSHCGTEVPDEALLCPKCGASVDHVPKPLGPRPGDAKEIGYAVLGFLIPVVGFVLFLVWQQDYPLRAKSAGKGALYSTGVLIFLAIFIKILSGLPQAFE